MIEFQPKAHDRVVEVLGRFDKPVVDLFRRSVRSLIRRFHLLLRMRRLEGLQSLFVNVDDVGHELAGYRLVDSSSLLNEINTVRCSR